MSMKNATIRDEVYRCLSVYSDSIKLAQVLREEAQQMVEDECSSSAYWLKESAINLEELFNAMCEISKLMELEKEPK